MLGYYLFILLFGSLSAFASQNRRKGGGVYFRSPAFIISFLILFFFTCFTDSGDDYESFREIVDTISWENPIFGTSEIGFNYFCLVIKTIVESPDMVLFVIKGLSLTLTFISLYLLRNSINIGFSYLTYVLLYWLPSLFVIPLFFSASLCTLAFAIFLTKGNKVWPIILILLAAQIHTGAYFGGVFYIYLFFLKKKKDYFINNVVLVLGTVIGTALISVVIHYLSATYGIIHYDEYERSAGGTGFKTILEYLILLFVVIWIKYSSKDNYYAELVFVFFLFDVAISVINFSFGTAGRMHYLVMTLYLVIFSMYCFQYRGKGNIAIVMLYLLCFINGFLSYKNFTSGPIVFVDYRLFNPFSTL